MNRAPPHAFVKTPVRRLLVFALYALVAGGLAEAAATDEPQVLPELKVGAEVPLIKVAEYQMIEPRYAPAVVARGNYVYIIGGLNSLNVLSPTIERFDVKAGRSEIIGRLNVARMWHRAVLVRDKIYVMGGVSLGLARAAFLKDLGKQTRTRGNEPSPPLGNLDAEGSVEIIDLATGKVTVGPTMLHARQQFGSVAVDNQIFVFGGQRDYRGRRAMTTSVQILDLKTGKWSEGPPMPGAPRTGEAVLVDGGFIVVTGGYDGDTPRNEVDAFDVRTRTWKTIAPMCGDRSAHASVFTDHYLFVFGDYEHPEELLAYDLKTKSSEIFTLGYTPSRNTGAVQGDDGRIYVVGGVFDRRTPPMKLIQVFEVVKKKKSVPPALAVPAK